MTKRILRGVAMIVVLAGAVGSTARVRAQEDRGLWNAASSNARAITGEILHVDGGFHAMGAPLR